MAKRLSFCMVTTFYPPHHFGGDAMHVYRLANELARREHHVTVVSSVDSYRMLVNGEPTADFPNEPGVELVRIRRGRAAPVATYLSGRPALNAGVLRQVLDRGDYDVVHFHNVSLVGGPGVLAYGRGVKLYTTHEHWLVCPMHVLWKYDREPCVQPACFRCSLVFRRPPQAWRYTSLLERSLGEIDLFLAPSRFTRDAHLDRGFDRPIRTLPYFLPTTAAPAREVSEPRRPYFLYVGRLERLKGVETLIERFRTYRDADLVVAGDGEHGAELRRQARGLEHVHLLGRVHPSDLPRLYAGAVALLVPSVGYEVFGIVILEAFAQRTPAIVHDLGALPEVIAESGGGRTYRTDDELLAAMEELRLHSRTRSELGAKGHAAWLAHWSEDPHVSGYFEAIEEARALARR